MNDTTGSVRPAVSTPFDAWSVLDFWRRRWYVLAAWTVVLAIVGGVLAHLLWVPSYTALAQLVHYEPSAADDTYRPRSWTTPSLVVMLQSPELMDKLGARMQPPMTGKTLSDRLQIALDRNNDVATVTANGHDADEAVAIANGFCDEAIRYT